MAISKPSVVKTTVTVNDVKDSEIVTEPRLETVPSTHLPGLAPAGRSLVGSIISFLTGTLLLAGIAAGWIYREAWWPKVAPLIGLETKAPVKPPKPPTPVVTAVVQQKDMEVYINGLGTVTAFKTVTMRSRVEGELVNVAFTEGQMVHEGDLLAEIDRRPFDVQLQQSEGQLARDEATLKTAEFTLKRYQELQQKNSIAPQQVDEQRSLVQQTIGAIQSDHASVANAKLQLDYCRIVAPINGRIGLRLVDQGNIVRANDPSGIAVITQLQPISLVFTIPQDDISRVQKASLNGHELTVLAYDRNLKVKLATGKLLAIDNQVDATTGTVRLKAIFDNEDGLLFPNQFVNARLLVDRKKNAVVVPTAAVQRGPSSYFVYVVQADEKVDLRTVTPGIAEGAETSIDSGLSPGEIVVTEGLDKLQKGADVQTKPKEDKEKKPEAGDKKQKADESKPSPTDKKLDTDKKLSSEGKSNSDNKQNGDKRSNENSRSEKPADKKNIQ